MHSQQPPIAHRDIKVENILLHNKKFKLCDFGSASTATLSHFGLSEDAIDETFESYEKYTTMMYRPPEMIDKYKRWNVTTKVDIWVSRIAFSNAFFKPCLDDWLRCLHSNVRTTPLHGEPKTSHLHSHLQLPADPSSRNQAPRLRTTLPYSRPRAKTQHRQTTLHLGQLLPASFNQPSRCSSPS